MKNLHKILKDGSADFIFGECDYLNSISNDLLGIYKNRGYSEIQTPLTEYFDVFSGPETGQMIKPEDVYSFFDDKNCRIALRPDCTLPIARVVATKIKNKPIPFRLCYSQKTIRVNSMPSESTQCGIELIGDSGLISDVESLYLAAKSLSSFDQSYRIEIAHGNLLNVLFEEYNIDNNTSDIIKELIEQKNFSALSEMNIPYSIKHIPEYFGGVEVLDDFLKIEQSENIVKILSYLRSLYENLNNLGLGQHVSFDLGIVNSLNYYTGIIFTGYINNSGKSVLSGGRYDKLLSKYGVDLPAIGFCVNVDLVFNAFKDEKIINKSFNCLVASLDNDFQNVFSEIDCLVSRGLTTLISYKTSKNDILEEAKKNNIKNIIIFDGKVKTEINL